MGDKKELVPPEVIVTKIIFLRGEKVLLDRDLAELYGVETRVLKQAVRRNIKRFPEDFMFELTEDENRALRSQNVTLKRGSIPNTFLLPSPNKVWPCFPPFSIVTAPLR